MILMVFPHLAVAGTALLIREGGGCSQIFFLALLASIWPKNKAGGGGERGGRAPSLDPPLLIQQLCKFVGMNERAQFLRLFVIPTWPSCPHFLKTILNLFFFFLMKYLL